MGNRTQIGVASFSFDDFVAFLFEHEVPSELEKFDPWYWHVESADFDAEKVCGHYIRLFQSPEFLLTRFTKAQLDQGFWAVQVPNLDCSAYRIIHDSDLPLGRRGECIRAMADLFEKLFANDGLDTSVHMWRDSLCYDWHCGNRDRARGCEDEQLQGIFFETLTRILFLDSEICQGAALHGLGHLHHPATPRLIETYLSQGLSLTKDRKDYARAAARFEVM